MQVLWAPQEGPQLAALEAPFDEIFYGGARGGGKSDLVLGDWLFHQAEYGRDARGLIFRREAMQLSNLIARAREIYVPAGALERDDGYRWKFPGGAELLLRPLERDAYAEKYQGHSYTRVYGEEIGNFANPSPIRKMKATLRSAAGVPCRMINTGNPGGPGHNWIREWYISPAPGGFVPILDQDSGLTRVYIPARLGDNKILTEQDPLYMGRIKQSGSPELVRAWLEGDWDVIEGAYFPEWGKRHIIRPRWLPPHWVRFTALDWGSATPFSVGWYAVSDGTVPGIPEGAIVRYREWYGVKHNRDGSVEANVGVKKTAEEVARGMLARESGETITYRVADPNIFAETSGPSIGERMAAAGVVQAPAENRRVATHGAMGGWDQMRAMLKGGVTLDEDEPLPPLFYVFDTGKHFIRTFPMLQHNPDRPEDVLKRGEDHAGDEGRYACMSRPWVAQVEPPRLPGEVRTETFQELVERNLRSHHREQRPRI